MDQVKKHEYVYSNDTGDAVLTVYSIFPGVEVVYNSVHMDHFDMSDSNKTGRFIEIHHCLEGRIEQEFGSDFFYLMPGDLSLAKREQMVRVYTFPLRHYHGVTIAIDLDKAPKSLSTWMADVHVNPQEVADRLCQEKKCVILRGNAKIEHIFSEMYTISEHQRIPYLKIKLLELMFVLNLIDPTEEEELVLPRSQVQLAKAVADHLADNTDRRITIPELAKTFGVSDTYLKNAFKGVYGIPVFSYVRIQKMYKAAELLIHTERSVDDIAEEVGYSNESKFSAAFREIMGENPGKYRKNHTKITIL